MDGVSIFGSIGNILGRLLAYQVLSLYISTLEAQCNIFTPYIHTKSILPTDGYYYIRRKRKKGWWIEYSVIWEKFWNSQEDKEQQHQWRVDLRRGIKPVPGNAASIWGVAMEHGTKEERCWLFVPTGIVTSLVACCLQVGLSSGYWLSWEERCVLIVLNGIVASQVACCLHVGLSRGYWLSWARLYRGSICYPSPLEALISFHPCCLSASVVVVLLRALRIRMHRRMFVWSMILAFWLSSWTATAILFDSPYPVFTWTLKRSDAERAQCYIQFQRGCNTLHELTGSFFFLV